MRLDLDETGLLASKTINRQAALDREHQVGALIRPAALPLDVHPRQARERLRQQRLQVEVRVYPVDHGRQLSEQRLGLTPEVVDRNGGLDGIAAAAARPEFLVELPELVLSVDPPVPAL